MWDKIVVSFDFASLYPTTMKTYSMKNLLREKKIIRILEKIKQCQQTQNT